MVMTTIALMALLLAEFTFDTKVNKLKVYNIQDREQAKLNAEAGLKFALAKMRIYKEGFNLLQKNESAKSAFPQSKLESTITQPFMFPIPLGKNANVIQKSALEEFTKNSLIRGSMMVDISQVSGFLNPNGLRIPKPDPNAPEKKTDEENAPPHAIIEKQFVETLTNSWQQKKDSDEEFNALYRNLNVTNLVRELKYYVNSPGGSGDQEIGEVENLYSGKSITPKNAPMSSLSEMYLLQGWDDAIIDLIKDRLSVHEVSIIPLNQITKEQLRLIFPTITDEQIAEFFKYRDGAQGNKAKNEDQADPHPFDSEEDFKNLIVNQLNVVADAQYAERIKELQKAGYRLGVAGKLFKISSKGEYGRAQYIIVAYVDLPLKPLPPEKPKPPTNPLADTDPDKSDEVKPPPASATPAPKKNLELLEPRIVEIRTN